MGFRGIFAMLAGMAVTAAYGQEAQQPPIERPPQFVMLAFDNCTELERWQDLADFSAEMNRDGARLHFTFFVSGINLIEDANRNIYSYCHSNNCTHASTFLNTNCPTWHPGKHFDAPSCPKRRQRSDLWYDRHRYGEQNCHHSRNRPDPERIWWPGRTAGPDARTLPG